MAETGTPLYTLPLSHTANRNRVVHGVTYCSDLTISRHDCKPNPLIKAILKYLSTSDKQTYKELMAQRQWRIG